MKLPEIDALPGCKLAPKKTKACFVPALIILPFLAMLAAIFNEFPEYPGHRSALLRIPAEVYDFCYIMVVVLILYYVRRGMRSFYRPFGNLWMALMVLLSVSAVADLFTIGSDDMISPAGIVSALAACIAWGVGLSLGIRLSGSYAGRMAVMARRLKVASIFGIICYGMSLIMFVSVDSTCEDAMESMAGFGILIILFAIVAVVLQIRAMITALDLLDKGSELGWCDDIYVPDGIGHPVADELHIPEGAGPDWKPMGVADESASVQSVVSRMCKTFPETAKSIDLSGGMPGVINTIRHLASTKVAKYSLCAVALLALAGICYKVLHKGEVESLFADVKAPDVSLDRVIDNGEYTLRGFSLYEYEVKDEDSGSTKSHQWVRSSSLTLWFHPEDADNELGIPVLAHFYVGGRYSENHYGIGFLKNNTLTIYQAKEVDIRYGTSFIVPRPYICYPDRISECMVAINLEDNLSIMFTADVSNIANFKTSVHCDSLEYLTEFYDCLLDDRLSAATPTSVYRSDNGTEIRVQFFRAPENDMGIKAIAAGEIYDSPEIGHDDVFMGPLFDNSVFPIVATSCLVEIGDAKLYKDKIVVTNHDGEDEDKEMTMPLMGRMIFDNVMLEKSIAQLQWDPIYHDSDNIEPEEDASEESILAAADKMYDDIPNVDFDDEVKNMRNAGFDNISISGNFSGDARNITDIALFPYDANLKNLGECDRWTIVGRNKTASIEGIIHSYYPQLFLEGDLNGNGKDEFGILRAYSASNYYSYQLYEFDEDVESNILYAFPIGEPIKVSCPLLYENGLTVDDIVTKVGGGKVRIITYEITGNGHKTLSHKYVPCEKFLGY